MTEIEKMLIAQLQMQSDQFNTQLQRQTEAAETQMKQLSDVVQQQGKLIQALSARVEHLICLLQASGK